MVVVSVLDRLRNLLKGFGIAPKPAIVLSVNWITSIGMLSSNILPMSNVLSIAYGSNLHPNRIRDRVPSAKALGVVSLPGFSLAFHKRSKKDGSGKGMLYKADGATAYGVIYEIPLSEKPGLDTAEGLGFGYDEREIKVDLNGLTVIALIYMASQDSVNHQLKPYHWYKKMVLAGAVYHGLPASYITSIEAAASIQDLDKERNEQNEALLRGWPKAEV